MKFKTTTMLTGFLKDLLKKVDKIENWFKKRNYQLAFAGVNEVENNLTKRVYPLISNIERDRELLKEEKTALSYIQNHLDKIKDKLKRIV